MDETLIRMLERNLDHAAEFEDRFDSLQVGQAPTVVTICCSDSRVLQDEIWGNQEPGFAFTCGNIGNRVVQDVHGERVVSGDVLYPIEHTNTRTAVVVGHTGCGAVTATYDAITGTVEDRPGIEHCINLLAPLLRPGVEALPHGLERATAINYLVEYNADRQIEFLAESEDVPDDLRLVGVVYDFQDVYDGKRGEVHVINVDGERDLETLRSDHPEVADRIDRLFVY